ncbi:MAG: caspase, partial [Chloroflexi bacterium]
MSPCLYALLVGINDYPDPRHRLAGCVNDVTRMERYLRARTAQERFDLQLQTLTDSQAGRDAIVAAFGRLGPARAGDVVFFFFSGHGSQAVTPPELRPDEPDGLDETLVCWDSRTPGGWDLADKELAQLIAAAGAQGAHVLVILDCCHSGSGTRAPLQAANERRIARDERPRPFTSYL